MTRDTRYDTPDSPAKVIPSHVHRLTVREFILRGGLSVRQKSALLQLMLRVRDAGREARKMRYRNNAMR